jgi:uracil-DNA glycosylase family 4
VSGATSSHGANLDTLQALHAEIRACRACERAGYLACAAPVAGAQGPANARLMIIGQAPGRLTVERGLMFGGPSGLLLERWLTQAGFAPGVLRREVYLTALTRCDPGRSAKGRGDRKPTAVEVALCKPYLERELAHVRPSVLLLVGGMAIEAFLGAQRLDDIIGQTFEHEGATVIPLPHPSGVSRWLNDPAHQALVARALARLAEFRVSWG